MSFPNKTAAFLYQTSLAVFFFGFPNYWIDDLNISKSFYKVYRRLSQFFNVTLACLILFELGSFGTQNNLTKKQETDLMIYAISHPFLLFFSFSLWTHDDEVKIFFALILRLKQVYNNEEIEEIHLKKMTRDSIAMTISCVTAVFLHTTSALIQFFKSEGTFTTLVTAWPLVDDYSFIANIARVITYCMWWMLMSRIISSYTMVIVLGSCVSHQYMNLQSYFYCIEEIFEDKHLLQHEKEIKYEKAFVLGVELHSSTIECVEQLRRICQSLFSAELIFVITLLVFLMTQMMLSERSMVNAAATAITAAAVLISASFVLWNAGDITVEASKLPTAMYSSGWHNCHGNTSIRIRMLLLIAMTHAQKPVIIKGLGMMALSYGSYLSLVKFSYSVFSVIY